MKKILFCLFLLVSCCTTKAPPVITIDNSPTPQFGATSLNGNAIPIFGYIRESTASDFKNLAASQILDGVKEIKVFIDSEGGEIDAANEIGDYLDMIKTPSVCTVFNMADSGALAILQHCTTRIAHSNDYLMFHDPVVKARDFQRKDIPSLTEEVDIITERFHQFETKRMINMSYKEFCDHLKKGFWAITPQTALQYGFLDRIIP